MQPTQLLHSFMEILYAFRVALLILNECTGTSGAHLFFLVLYRICVNFLELIELDKGHGPICYLLKTTHIKPS